MVNDYIPLFRFTLATGIFTLMGYPCYIRELGNYFNVGGNLVQVPHKDLKSAFAKQPFESLVKGCYSNWCLELGKTYQELSLDEIYVDLYEKADKTSQAFLTSMKSGLIFDPNETKQTANKLAEEALAA